MTGGNDLLSHIQQHLFDSLYCVTEYISFSDIVDRYGTGNDGICHILPLCDIVYLCVTGYNGICHIQPLCDIVYLCVSEHTVYCLLTLLIVMGHVMMADVIFCHFVTLFIFVCQSILYIVY